MTTPTPVRDPELCELLARIAPGLTPAGLTARTSVQDGALTYTVTFGDHPVLGSRLELHAVHDPLLLRFELMLIAHQTPERGGRSFVVDQTHHGYSRHPNNGPRSTHAWLAGQVAGWLSRIAEGLCHHRDCRHPEDLHGPDGCTWGGYSVLDTPIDCGCAAYSPPA